MPKRALKWIAIIAVWAAVLPCLMGVLCLSHDCAGENCLFCLAARRAASALCALAPLAFFSFASAPVRALFPARIRRIFRPDTPVKRFVRLND